jgi:hypothetical protein
MTSKSKNFVSIFTLFYVTQRNTGGKIALHVIQGVQGVFSMRAKKHFLRLMIEAQSY